MNLRNLEDWIVHCQKALSEKGKDPLAGGGWMMSMSTPPPSLSDPLERLPLERARELREAAETAAQATERTQLLSVALDWLAHPYPRTSPTVERLLAAERRQIIAALEADG